MNGYIYCDFTERFERIGADEIDKPFCTGCRVDIDAYGEHP